MSVHTCPRCELRFSFRAEVADHLFTDHRVDALSLAGVGHLAAAGAAGRLAPNLRHADDPQLRPGTASENGDVLVRQPAAHVDIPTPPATSRRDSLRRLLEERLAVPPWILIVQLFIGMGWLRAAVEKVIDPGWWTGTALTSFLTAHADTVLPWYQPIVDIVVEPNILAISAIVVVAQLVSAAALLSGRKLLTGIAVGAFLNLNFIALGAVDPSIFYLICQAVILLWALDGAQVLDRARNRSHRLLATGSIALVALNLPFVSTLDPHSVIEDPAIILVTLGLLVATTSVLAVGQPEPSPLRHEPAPDAMQASWVAV